VDPELPLDTPAGLATGAALGACGVLAGSHPAFAASACAGLASPIPACLSAAARLVRHLHSPAPARSSPLRGTADCLGEFGGRTLHVTSTNQHVATPAGALVWLRAASVASLLRLAGTVLAWAPAEPGVATAQTHTRALLLSLALAAVRGRSAWLAGGPGRPAHARWGARHGGGGTLRARARPRGHACTREVGGACMWVHPSRVLRHRGACRRPFSRTPPHPTRTLAVACRGACVLGDAVAHSCQVLRQVP
jgi:hypothetical protein